MANKGRFDSQKEVNFINNKTCVLKHTFTDSIYHTTHKIFAIIMID